jgi:hypothetical protein
VGTAKIGLIDQQLLLLNNALSVLENLRLFAPSGMAEHELRIRLGRFLFYGETVFKKAACLSGGERMRLALACLLATGNAWGNSDSPSSYTSAGNTSLSPQTNPFGDNWSNANQRPFDCLLAQLNPTHFFTCVNGYATDDNLICGVQLF